MATKRKSERELVVSAAAAAPVRRKSPAKTHVKRSAASVETPSSAPPRGAALETTQEPTAGYAAVAQLAYSYWEARGCQGGSPEEDWLRAERELGVTA